MRYTYDIFADENGFERRLDTTTNFDEADDNRQVGQCIEVTDNLTHKKIARLNRQDEVDEWRMKLERDEAWKPLKEEMSRVLGNKKDHINPPHYQNFIDEMQWVEVMQKIAKSKDQDFNVFLEYTVRKYLDRCGKKDSNIQELRKALWYLRLWIARLVSNNEPVKVEAVDKILSEL